GDGVRRLVLWVLLAEADQLAVDPPDADGLGASLAAHPVVGVVAEVLGVLAAAGVHWLAVTLAPALMRDQVVCDLARERRADLVTVSVCPRRLLPVDDGVVPAGRVQRDVLHRSSSSRDDHWP